METDKSKQNKSLPLLEFLNIAIQLTDILNYLYQNRVIHKEIANKITINTELLEDKKQVIIQIKDHGIGMSPEVQSQIFKHLFTTKSVGKGTGLGLAIVRQIVVEKHQGSISVNSVPGIETVFAITLPLKALV